MTIDNFRAVLESELAWRQEELNFFKNQLNSIEDNNDRNRYRKSLVLILYSHLEGYIKIALQTYIQYINDLALPRKDVIPGLMVAGMHKEFLAYENLDRKCDVFRRELPQDSALHRYYRRVDFVEQLDEFREATLKVDDSVIDTESNMWYIVLQKNLYKVGLPIDMFDQYRKPIDALVNRRNSIAHGNSHSGVSQDDFLDWESKVSGILTDVTILLYDYANHHRYLKSS